MLGKSKPATNTSAVETQTAKIGTIIGPGAVFKGDITAPEAIRIDGTLTGNCDCKGNLILGTEGQIKGNITAQSALISGRVDGDITVDGKMELLSTGRVVGDVSARSLVIDEDAFFDGRCTMAGSPSGAAQAAGISGPDAGAEDDAKGGKNGPDAKEENDTK